MRIVIDTNIIVSAIFFGGKPQKLVNLVLDSKIDVFASKEILLEYKETIQYLLNKYNNQSLNTSLSTILSSINVIESNTDIKICRDSDDNKFLNCAIDAKAAYIVTGDQDLLTLKKYKNIKIVTVNEFLKNNLH